MIRYKIVCVGNLKDGYYVSAASEYVKRLSRYAKTEIVEIKEENFVKTPEEAEKRIILKKEGAGILKNLEGEIIILDVSSREVTSEEFARIVLRKKEKSGVITFVIGGSYGISEEVKKSGEKLSFSKMTYPHGLFRVMLLEQLYRAETILNNVPYHK